MIFGLAAIIILALIFMGVAVPLAFLGGSFFVAYMMGTSTGTFATNSFYILNSISMLAIPLFIVGGALIERSGIANVLIKLADKMLHNVKGGLTATIPVVSCFFGALCGSALATANTLSTAMVPELERKGYDRAYLAALIAASSPFGFMIPPNVNAIIFASVTSASVGALFMATIVPGVLWTLLYLVINRLVYHKYYHPELAATNTNRMRPSASATPPESGADGTHLQKLSPMQFWIQLTFAVLMPVIVLGGIYGGIFTATEAGAITCLYGALVGVLVYKKITIRQLFGVLTKGTKDVSALVVMFPMTLIFSRLMTVNHIPELVAELMLSITNNKIGLILLIDLLLFMIGFFLDGNVIILTLVPLLTPIASACGIDTIQLAVIVFVSIGIGSITPPMATCLMACSRVCDVPIHKLVNPILPFLLFGALPILLLVSFAPALSTWLPGLFYSF
ncbi:TRAP transporter large permease [Petroclostridium sp. X23]|uniref:TRAP transporter large permease n=1 Tax=Petroclostridium sp. X23 TaxID=3045146 RepID=UPI0024AD9F35|nr:TRAP transporter large permease [Petroclostridium sp. X23]WHH56855.1 TRAP transporter large permease [Petroclostridium sp. X23]